MVKIIVSPEYTKNSHEVVIKGRSGTITTLTENVPSPANPKTSYLATLSAIAMLITHRHGITKGSPGKVRIIPFINKIDLNGGLVQGRKLAREILKIGHPSIKQVLLGQARMTNPVVEIISEGDAG